jgi:hypothetical protein
LRASILSGPGDICRAVTSASSASASKSSDCGGLELVFMLSPMTALEVRLKAMLSLPTSSGRSEPELHGCGRIWCISASSPRIRSGRRQRVESAPWPGIADSLAAPPCEVSKSMAGNRSCLHPADQAGAQHSQSPVKAEKPTVIRRLNPSYVAESTYKLCRQKWFRFHIWNQKRRDY